MDFDKVINRLDTHSLKWDMMESLFGVSPKNGISMWVADMDFPPPEAVTGAVKTMLANQVMGYYGDDRSYKQAIINWMSKRHGWQVEPEWIFTTHGLVNAFALCIQTFTEKNDGVIIFTPVYHMFAKTIKAAERQVISSELVNNNGRYEMDLEALEASLTGNETMMLFCSPHNPSGRVWTAQELKSVAEFCQKHNLLLVSDEIHHDLVFGGNQHTIMSLAAPEHSARTIILTAATKTFNLAASLTGNVIIADPALRAQYAKSAAGLGIAGNAFGMNMVEAAYKHGEKWLEECVAYIDGNRKIFDEALNQIPGVVSMKLDSTYLAWVDFSGTGMSREEIAKRVQIKAEIAASPGLQYSKETGLFLRFNLACSRKVVIEATERLKLAFADLQ
ncbi:MAG: pyridoxal phosphate-dependent aminotransferase [Rhizobiales bacterium]|nr:pyridoxal phosphate-dependent aminotransferase [Hyphomicrobiales bacterium]NRB13297.1 pyridoxal phosphate-dependent aminotransferase [Hyphomicrobiales bacterium]